MMKKTHYSQNHDLLLYTITVNET